MTLFKKVFEWAKSNPLYALILAVALIVVLFWFKDTLGAGLERINRWRFEKAVAAERAEIQKLQAENAKLLEDAKKAFAKGEAIELQRDAAYAELERYGAAAKAAVEAQKKAGEEYAKDKAAIDLDVSLHQRCLDLCSERAEVGYPCKPSISGYCDRYAGR